MSKNGTIKQASLLHLVKGCGQTFERAFATGQIDEARENAWWGIAKALQPNNSHILSRCSVGLTPWPYGHPQQQRVAVRQPRRRVASGARDGRPADSLAT